MRAPNCTEEFNGLAMVVFLTIFLILALLPISVPVRIISGIFFTITFIVTLFWMADDAIEFGFMFEKLKKKE